MRQSRRNSWLVIAIIALLSAGACWTITGMKFSYDFEAFFPQDDPETDFYLAFRETFERDNDFYIIALENPAGVFQYDFLSKVDSLTNALKQVAHVREVIGPTQLEGVELGMLGEPITYPLLNWQDSLAYAEDSVRIMNSDEILSRFFSRDGKALAIQIKHDAILSKTKSDALADDIARVVEPFQFHRVHSIGRVLGQKLYVELMLRELILFISLSLLLTILFLYIAFRSAWGIIIPTLVVLISIIWTIGFIGILGRDLDLMLTILPTILFVVGMSDSVHVLTKYMQELRNGKPKAEAIRYAFKSIRLATFLTALTTSVGFLTLVLSNIQPISNFGIYTSVGIMLAYGLTYTMLPAILLLAEPKRLNTFALSDDFWTKKLHSFFGWILRFRGRVVWGTLVILAISVIGISMLEVDNKMLEDLRDDHILKREFAYLEDQFTGCRPFELAVTLPNAKSIQDTSVLRELNQLQHYLEQDYGVRDLMSYPRMICTLNKVMNGGDSASFVIPSDTNDIKRIQRLMRRGPMAQLTQLLYSDSALQCRFAGRVGDVGRVHYEAKNDSLQRFIQANIHSGIKCQVTGTAHLIDLNNRYLVENMVWDLLLSVLVIGLIMGIVYRSPRMIILTIIPNLIPLLIVGGIMGFAGIPVKVSTSIIFNIAFGIAVDDTIHFLARVRTLIREGMPTTYAVKRTFLTTGKAMVVTTLILSAGFLTLILSDFMGTFYIGFLISLTLFIALIAELLVSPLVILYFYRPKSR